MKNFTVSQFLSILSWKAFIMTFVFVFCMVFLEYLGVKVPNFTANFFHHFVSPLPTHVDPFARISPKLHERLNSYSLKHETSFIPQANASMQADNAAAYIVVDYDSGQVLYEKNAMQKLPIASLTKLMTAVTALDLVDRRELMKVSSTAGAEESTKIGVVPGQKLKLEELLHAMLLTSANDAAEVVRDGVEERYGAGIFVKAMNDKASFLGMGNSHFDNPQGFDSRENYSSAEDLSVLSHYALSTYPVLDTITQKNYVFLPSDQNHKQYDLYNWNGLLDVYPGVMGVKIGITEAAHTTTIVLSEREGRKVLVVLLGAPGVLERDMWAAELLDAGFQKAAHLDPINVTEQELRVKYASWKYFG